MEGQKIKHLQCVLEGTENKDVDLSDKDNDLNFEIEDDEEGDDDE